MSQDRTDSESDSTITVVQEVRSPLIADQSHVMTVLINHPPGAPGYPPHRLPGGPGFGYMIDGEMLFELEGEAPRVLHAGDAFWGPGGEVIHYQDANNRTDIPCSFVLTLFYVPGQPLREWVTDEELEQRKGLRVMRTDTAVATPGHDSENQRVHQWREVTRELVLAGATAIAATYQPQSQGSISISLTGKALSEDLVLADTGTIALTSLGDHTDGHSHAMSVVPMRLDTLSDLPAICVVGRGITEPTQLRLAIELTASDPHTATTYVLTCGYDPILLDAQTSLATLDFRLQRVEPHRQRPHQRTQSATRAETPGGDNTKLTDPIG